MKQKKKACGSGGMGLVLMGVKKGTFDKTKNSKEERKDRVRVKRFKIVSKIDLVGLRQNTYKHTNPQKEIKETLKS
ncbi:hypothetical protein AGMMS50222_01520 [Endomicrobiia bacterium]|nr:hypothetical protein AGMMS49531_06730 [Endomicrobiia bacterium]GHT64003.1 hypothetical protein AGMMS49556_01380 [Endomicrobiia bacterium]GHT71834.1 hypothetical protein AGMMS49950_09200 [Endomicrobiia bacterium]GHT73667.1 hypothetical protein AGMMS50222_01520 [Endomicrobiia bacterium]